MLSTPETMQHEVPLHPTSLTKWRQRVGAEKLVEMIQETIVLALAEKLVTKQELSQVNVDTTVQEKPLARLIPEPTRYLNLCMICDESWTRFKKSRFRPIRSCTSQPFSSWLMLRRIVA